MYQRLMDPEEAKPSSAAERVLSVLSLGKTTWASASPQDRFVFANTRSEDTRRKTILWRCPKSRTSEASHSPTIPQEFNRIRNQSSGFLTCAREE